MNKSQKLSAKISYLLLSLSLLIIGLIGISRLELRPTLSLTWQTTDSGIEIIHIDPNAETPVRDINAGDILVGIDNRSVKDGREIEFYLDTKITGESITLNFLRNSDIYTISLILTPKWDRRFIIMNLLLGILFWIVGVFIYFKKPLERSARVFSIGCLVTSAAIMMVWWGYPYNNSAIQDYLPSFLYFIFYPAVPAIVLYFSCIYPEEKELLQRNKLFHYLLFIPCFAFVLLLEGSYLAAIKLETYSSIRTFFNALVGFRIYLISYMALSIFFFLRSHKYAVNREVRNRIQWVLWSISLGIAPFLLLWTLPLALIHRALIPEEINYLFLMIIPLAISFSIVKYRLFDIEIIINRSIVYLLVTGIIVSIYLLLSGFAGYFLETINPSRTYISFTIICTLIAAILFSPLKQRIQNLVDKTFYRLKYNYRLAVKDFGSAVFSTLDKTELLNLLMEKINEVIPVERIALVLKTPASEDYELSCSYGLNKNEKIELRFKLNSDLVKFIDEHKTPMIRKGRESFAPSIELPDVSILNKLGIEMLIPIDFQHQLSGFLIIGQKLSKIKFSEEDISLLSTMLEESFIALERLRLQESMILERIEKEKLEELNELKSEFISHISHELRTPITAIFWSVENLLDGVMEKPGPKVIEYLEGISDNSKHLGRMIENLLDITKIEAGKIDIYLEKLILYQEVEKCCEIMKPFCEEKDIKIDFSCPDNLQIKADPDYLRTILINLLSNAIKYSPKGSIVKINTETAIFDNEKKTVISVIDNGSGIEKGKQKLIFERFERVRVKNGSREKGLGLGLYIVKKLVELQGGEIRVESESNKGSTFTVLFPMA